MLYVFHIAAMLLELVILGDIIQALKGSGWSHWLHFTHSVPHMQGKIAVEILYVAWDYGQNQN